MKINKVVVRRFKRFGETTFELGDNVVLAGPNNSGKTTLLQAIATWSLALGRWLELRDSDRHSEDEQGEYTKVPIARQAFYSVPLRTFELLWNNREKTSKIEIELTFAGNTIAMEILSDSTEQVYVRPTRDFKLLWFLAERPKPVFVPPMSGISIEEPVYQPPKINQLLGQGKTGDVLRNLLLEVNSDSDKWEQLTYDVKKMFGCQLLRPNADGASIIVDYLDENNKAQFDIASAGSGFLQVLMLLTFLQARTGSVLLLDEPDAHLHLILQDTIYGILRDAARKSNSQLIIATHSEVVINAVDPRELCAIVGGKPTKLIDSKQKETLVDSLKIPNVDILLALEKKRILYLDGNTDLNILREWAVVLGHPLSKFLQQPCWQAAVTSQRSKGEGVQADTHFAALLLADEGIRGAQIIDRDGKTKRPAKDTASGGKLLKLCWARYEIENYLVHPDALARIVQRQKPDSPLADVDAMRGAMGNYLPGLVVKEPMENHDILLTTKMRKSILPAILHDAGLINMPYTRYAEIAEVMQPDEIHPEVTEKLDEIAKHFKLV